MNLVGARNAVLPERPKLDPTVDTLVHNGKCFLQSVLLVGKKPQYLSNPAVTSQYIAVTVTNHVHEAIGKHLKEAFLGFNTWEGFFLPKFNLRHDIIFLLHLRLLEKYFNKPAPQVYPLSLLGRYLDQRCWYQPKH